MSEFEEGEQSRKLTEREQSTRSTEPKGIPFTFLPESQSGNTEGQEKEGYPPEVYLRVIHNLEQIAFEGYHSPQTNDQEMGVNNTLLMLSLGLQAVAYDHLGPEGQVNFKDYLFRTIKSQEDWEIQPINPTIQLYQNSFELTPTQGKLLQRIAEGLNLTYDPGNEYNIARRTFSYDSILKRPIAKDPDDPEEYKPHYDSEIKAYLQAKGK
jgi:hypothetical protein